MAVPEIGSAVPLRRYQIGEYSAVVLGEIESKNTTEYRYILAMVLEGNPTPKVYVTLEKNKAGSDSEGRHRLCVRSLHLDEDLGSSNQWHTVDAFTASALAVAIKLLGLTDEQAVLVHSA